MNKIAVIFFTVTILLSACKSDDRIVPVDVWSGGCAELAPDSGNYKLSGICCEYVKFPLVQFKQGDSFEVDGSYHSFTGAGFSNVPIRIRIKVEPNGKELNLSFSVNNVPHEFTLIPEPARIACYCYCD